MWMRRNAAVIRKSFFQIQCASLDVVQSFDKPHISSVTRLSATFLVHVLELLSVLSGFDGGPTECVSFV